MHPVPSQLNPMKPQPARKIASSLAYSHSRVSASVSFLPCCRSCFNREDFLSVLGEPESLAGMRRYAKHLELLEEGDPKQRDALTKRYCRGWFIGAKEEKKALEKDLRERHPDVVWAGNELKELNEAMWEGLVENALVAANKSETDVQTEAKGAIWKAAIARKLRIQTTAGNPWIAKRLNMGHPSRVTNLIRQAVTNK